MQPIAIIESPYKEKFATPRQPGLTPSVHASIRFFPEYCPVEAIRGLEGFSHIWLIFLFHHNVGRDWTPTVRPPRLGGNKRVGVYASRSPFRPNPIGLSAVRLLNIEQRGKEIRLEIEGPDLVDETPVLDVKPYIPYSDSLTDATGGFAQREPERLDVTFAPNALKQLQDHSRTTPQLKDMLIEILALDPRPAYKKRGRDGHEYGALLDQYQIRWLIDKGRVVIVDISDQPSAGKKSD